MTDSHGDLAEEYHGDAWIVAGCRSVPVRVHLSGHLEPLDGRYHWGGRISPSEEVTALFTSDRRAVVVRTPDGPEAAGSLVERDPWGGCRVAGTGRPPFPVPAPPDLAPPDPRP